MKKKRKGILKNLFIVVYIFLIGFWLSTGFAVQRIVSNQAYVSTTYVQTLEVEDVTYVYREVGQEHEQTILMIHGFLGSSYDFIEVMDDLKSTHHVIAVDLIGFGLSEKSLTFDYGKANQAAYLKKFLDLKGIESAIVMAHSMGGEVSIHLASDYPSYVESMILIGSAGYYEEGSNGGTPPALPTFFYDYVVNNYYLQRAFYFSAYSSYEVEQQLVTYDDFDEMFYVNRLIPGEVMRQFSIDNDSGTSTDKLSLIEQPTLLIWGSDDGFIPLETGIKMQAEMAEVATLEVIDQAGHLPFDTFFLEFMNKVKEFLQ
jgi:pimeloyl-ACP methyl ester carboxylesterase